MLSEVGDCRKYLARSEEEEELAAIRRHERTGRPLGSASFIESLEELTGRFLRYKKAGRKRRKQEK